MKKTAAAGSEPRSSGNRLAGQRRTGERLVALLIAGIALLNFPLLSMLRERGLVAGVPAHLVYLFAVWVLLVVATALVLRGGSPGSGDGPGAAEP